VTTKALSADLTTAIEVAPNARDLYVDRARIHRTLGDMAAAEADEQRARNVARNWPDPGEFILFLLLPYVLLLTLGVLIWLGIRRWRKPSSSRATAGK
jgi:hypothetical protein